MCLVPQGEGMSQHGPAEAPPSPTPHHTFTKTYPSSLYLFINTSIASKAVVAHAFNPSTLGGRGGQISEFEASLVYRVSFRTARAIQRNPVSKKTKSKKRKENSQIYKQKHPKTRSINNTMREDLPHDI